MAGQPLHATVATVPDDQAPIDQERLDFAPIRVPVLWSAAGEAGVWEEAEEDAERLNAGLVLVKIPLTALATATNSVNER